MEVSKANKIFEYTLEDDSRLYICHKTYQMWTEEGIKKEHNTGVRYGHNEDGSLFAREMTTKKYKVIKTRRKK